MKQKENYNGFKKVLKFIANVVSWTILVFLLLIAAFLAYYFIANKIYATKGKKYEPSVGLYTIVSPSMTPNLNVYDVILDVKVKKPEDIKVGDIITFISTSSISKGLTITHRVVAIVETEKGLEYKTQGDNNLTPDTTTVPFQNILGKVIIKIPQLGRIQYFLSSSSGWLIIVVIPAALIIISDIVKIIRLSKTKKKVNKALETEELKQEKIAEEKEQIKNKLKERYADNFNEPNIEVKPEDEFDIEKKLEEKEKRIAKYSNLEENIINYSKPQKEIEETEIDDYIRNIMNEDEEEFATDENFENQELKQDKGLQRYNRKYRRELNEQNSNQLEQDKSDLEMMLNESLPNKSKFELPKLRDDNKED